MLRLKHCALAAAVVDPTPPTKGDSVHQAATSPLYAVHWVFEKKLIWAALSGVQFANETCVNRTRAARMPKKAEEGVHIEREYEESSHRPAESTG
jgi:hypothetical protein